jgi:hypothetical protein
MNPRDAKSMMRKYLKKEASMGERSFNRISQIPVLKKLRGRDTIESLPFNFGKLCFRRNDQKAGNDFFGNLF